MNLRTVLLAAASAKALAIYDPNATLPAGDGPMIMALMPDGEDPPAQSNGDGPSITTLAVSSDDGGDEGGDVAITALPVDGSDQASNGEGDVSITGAVPTLYSFDFVGPTWHALKYHDATSGDLVDVVGETPITLAFTADGLLEGHAGCNNYSGGYTDPTDATLTIPGPLASTMMICASEEVNDQETAYLQLLEGTLGWSTSADGTGLELTDADGTVLAQYTSSEAPTDVEPLVYDFDFVGPTWRALKYRNDGTLVDVVSGSSITLDLADDGHLSGYAGCNNYSGGYTDPTDTSLTIADPLASTLMMCPDEEVNDQETAYLQLLEGTLGWSTSDDGTELELTDAEGNVVAQYMSSEAFEAYKTMKVEPQGSGGAAMAYGSAVVAVAMVAVAGLV